MLFFPPREREVRLARATAGIAGFVPEDAQSMLYRELRLFFCEESPRKNHA